MSARRLPVYLALDTSGSMRGEPIQAVNVGLHALMASLRQNPFARESVHLAIITFDAQIKEVLPLTAIDALTLPEITCPESGPTFLGEALHRICDLAARDVRAPGLDQQGDWLPLLFVMTDGKPSDTQVYEEAVARVRQAGFASIVACAAGPKSVPDQLRELTDKVVSLDTMDSSSFSSFFEWVSNAVAAGASDLPPPPPEVQLVL